MDESRDAISRYGVLALALLIVATVSATIISSCGGGGGSDSNGALCEQCGETDGACQTNFTVEPGPDQPSPCADAAAPNPCPLTLICRRKSDSAQQRCYPRGADSNGHADVNYQWVCDGSRPGGTAVPEPTLTAVPTNTSATGTVTTIAIFTPGTGV
jgi:hypothetical protein